MGSYRDLLVWQKAMDLVDHVYAAVRHFPHDELYVLSEQMRAAAISIPSNIAEGCGWSSAEFRQFVRHARGSALELQTQVLIARRQRFISEDAAQALADEVAEVGRLLNGLLKSLRTKN